MRTAAVTGAAGHLGASLVRKLLDEGVDVTTVDVVPCIHGSRHVLADVTDPETLRGVFDGCDVVFHLAAIVGFGGNRDLMWRVNVEGPVNVVEAATASGAVTVHVASVSSLGPTPNEGLYDEDYMGQAGVFYETTKQAGYWAVQTMIEGGAAVKVALPGGLFSSDSHTSFRVSPVLRTFVRRPIPVFGPSDLRQAFVHTDDAVDGVIRVARSGGMGESYLLVESVATFEEMVGLVCAAAGRREPIYVPSTVLRRAGGLVRVGSLLSRDRTKVLETWRLACGTSYAYISEKARRDLSWNPAPLRQRIEQVVAEVTSDPAHAQREHESYRRTA